MREAMSFTFSGAHFAFKVKKKAGNSSVEHLCYETSQECAFSLLETRDGEVVS